MISNNAKDAIFVAIEEETQNCIFNHGFFKNPHEFISVLFEELEETMYNNNDIKHSTRLAWECIKKDNINCIKSNVCDLYALAFENLQEWVQVCAVLSKYLKGCSNDKD